MIPAFRARGRRAAGGPRLYKCFTKWQAAGELTRAADVPDNHIMATPAPTLDNITLTPELEKFVTQRVASGQYQSISELVREALRLLEQREREREEAFASLKQKLQRGAEQEQRGELCDGDAFMEQLLARLGKQKLESGAA